MAKFTKRNTLEADFEIKVQSAVGADCSVDVSITCKICNVSSSLGMHDKPNSFLISNRTRHAKNCTAKKEKCHDQRTLNKFLKPQVADHTETATEQSKSVDMPVNNNNATIEVNKVSETSSVGLNHHKNNSVDKQHVFWMGSLSYCPSKIGGDSIDDFSVAKIDWSRQSKKQLSMLKVAMDPNQTKITDYYKLLDKIESLASS